MKIELIISYSIVIVGQERAEECEIFLELTSRVNRP